MNDLIKNNNIKIEKNNTTIKEALRKTISAFQFAKLENPQLEAEILISSLLKKDRSFIFAHPELSLKQNFIKQLKSFTKKRMANYPLAYLLGQKEFYGLNFKVNKNVLVPRPETELFIDHLLSKKQLHNNSLFIDLGTGSGCISISLAKNINGQDNAFIAGDISSAALKTALKNAKQNKVFNKIKFFKSDLLTKIFSFLDEKYFNNKRKFTAKPRLSETKTKSKSANYKKIENLIITANLPYLTPQQIKNSPSISQEPYLALEAGSDGLHYYQKLFKQLATWDKLSYFIKTIVMIEINPKQKNIAKNLIKKSFPQAKIEIKKDLAKKERLIIVNL
ncbi:MAG: peptide chain release factor N(5)-glutamine methyltransferase [Planctomycetes bacterium]|nr:peptide chain release factor N(5)-glutamine methyltransferase [Planctomycetota bacterium]